MLETCNVPGTMLSFFWRQLRIVTPHNGTEAFYISLSKGFAFFFYCCDKPHNQKQQGGKKGLAYMLGSQSYTEESQGRNSSSNRD